MLPEQMARERRLRTAFVDLTDTLHGEFDVAEYLDKLAHHVLDLLAAAGTRVLLADDHAKLRIIATATSTVTMTELVESPDVDAGPGAEAHGTGQAVSGADLDADADAHADADARRWPAFSAAARAAGARSVHAFPLRHRQQVIGAFELYAAGPGPFSDADLRLAESLGNIATITVLRERRQQRADTLARQLQQALDSRLVIEQAKGILSERGRLGIDQAFALLRGHARRHQMKLATLALQVIDGTVDTNIVTRGHAGQSPAERRSGAGGTSHRTHPAT